MEHRWRADVVRRQVDRPGIPVAIFVGVGALLLFKARTTVPAMMSDYVWLIACCVFFVGVHGWHVSKVIEWSQRQL